MARREQDDDGRHFRKVQEVLRTGSRATFGHAASKLMLFILEGSAADLEITPESFIVRFDWNTARHRYFTHLAPGVMSALLDWCELRAVISPRAARFAASRVPLVGYLKRPYRRIDRDVWFLPGTPVQVFVRAAQPTSALPLASALPDPIREPRRTVTLAQPHACPHCGHAALSYRNLVSAWLCGQCARSFSVGPKLLADIVEHPDTAAG